MAASGNTDENDAEESNYGCGCLWIGGALVTVLITWGVSGRGAAFGGFIPLFFLLIVGVFFGAAANNKFSVVDSIRGRLGSAGAYVVGFALLCVISAFGLTLRPGGFSLYEEVPAEGGTVGPFTVERGDIRVNVEVEQYIEEGSGSTYQRWSFVTVNLLDENQDYLSSFGGEFWHYAGYDGGDWWEEEDDEYEATIKMPSPGTYYLRLETESNVATSELSPVEIEVEELRWWGNPVPLRIVGYIAFFFGVVMFVAAKAGGGEEEADSSGRIDVDVDAGEAI